MAHRASKILRDFLVALRRACARSRPRSITVGPSTGCNGKSPCSCYPPPVRRALRLSILLLGLAIAVPAAAQDEFADIEDDTPPAEETPTPPAEDTDPPDEFSDAEDLEEPSPADGGQGEITAPDGERMRMLVVDAATFGIDPVVGRVASAQMRETGAARSATRVLTQAGDDQRQRSSSRCPIRPTPADLWRVSWVARVHRGAFARIWAHAGQYVIEVTVASLDGAGPFFARGTVGRRRPARGRGQPPAHRPSRAERVERAPRGGRSRPRTSGDEDPIDESGQTSGDPGDRRPAAPRATAPTTAPRSPKSPSRSSAAGRSPIQTEAVIGASQRLLLQPPHRRCASTSASRNTILLGAYVAYANLNARNDRAHNMLWSCSSSRTASASRATST